MKHSSLAIELLIVLPAAFLSLAQAPTPPADFAFRLEYGVCTTDVLDTFEGVFVRDLGSRVPVVSIPVMLPQRSTEVAFQSVVAAHFFDYPTDFHITPKTDCTVTPNPDGGFTASCSILGAVMPANLYKLTVRIAGVTHTVSWSDSFLPSTEEADRLRVMLQTIVEMIRSLPEFQRLPRPQVACA